MSALIVSQTVFYIVSSVAIIAIGAALFYAIWELIGILRKTRDVSEDLSLTYAKAKKGVKKIISLVSSKK